MWYSLDTPSYIELGYSYRNGSFIRVTDKMLFDQDGYQCYSVHSNGFKFSETGEPGTFNIEPYEIAGAIQNHPEYEGGPIRLLSCYAAAYDGGAAEQVADFFNVEVKACVLSVYVSEIYDEIYALPAGLDEDGVQELKDKNSNMFSQSWQEEQWIVYNQWL